MRGRRPGESVAALFDPDFAADPRGADPADRVRRASTLVPGSSAPDPVQPAPDRPLGRLRGRHPRLPRRGPRRLRPGPDRLPAEPPPVQLGGPGGRRLPGRPAPGRGLRRPGHRRRAGGRGRGPGRTPTRRSRLLGLPAHDVRQAAGHPPRLRAARSARSTAPSVFAATFPLAKDFKEAVAARQPISHYKPRSAAAKAIAALADELLAPGGEPPTGRPPDGGSPDEGRRPS